MLILGVRKLIDLLYDPASVLRGAAYYTGEGVSIHKELGYDNRASFSRLYKGVLITGRPDKLEIDKVADLKVVYTRNEIDRQIFIGRLQCEIYCWLCGASKYEVVIYHAPERQIIKRVSGKVRKAKVEEILSEAVEKWKKLHEVLGLK